MEDFDDSDDDFQESRSSFLSPNRDVNFSQKSSRNVQNCPQDDRRKNAPGTSKANVCDHCDKSFRDTAALVQHLYENLNVPTKKNRAFNNLQTKKLVTKSPEIFKCNICKEDFPDKSAAYLHALNKHSDESNFLSFKYSLEDKLSSNGEGETIYGLEDMPAVELFTPDEQKDYPQMYMCLKCSKVLSKDSILEHKAQHSNVKNAQLFVKVNIPSLSNIKKRESSTLNLTQPQNRPNKTSKQYMCTECMKVFPNAYESIIHRSNVHPEIKNSNLFINVDIPDVQKRVTVSQPVGKMQNLSPVKQTKSQIQNKSLYMCLKCNLVFSTYYSTKLHRSKEHPELSHCQLFTKVIVPNSQKLSTNKSPKSFHKTGNRESTKDFRNEKGNVREEVLHDENMELTPKKHKLDPYKYSAKRRKILQLTVEANKDVEENDSDEMSAENENNKVYKTVKIFQCGGCNLHFISLNTIRKHFDECNSEFEIAKANCRKCRLIFSSDELYNHILKHHSNVNSKFTVIKVRPTAPKVDVSETLKRRLFRCDICSVHFISAKSLNIHMSKSMHDPLTKVKCGICELTFSKNSLRKHIEIHHEQLKLSRKDLYISSHFHSNLCNVEKKTENKRQKGNLTPQRIVEDQKQEEKKDDRREKKINNNEISKPSTVQDSVPVGKDKVIGAIQTSKEPYETSFDRKIYKCNLCSIHFMKESFLLKHMTHTAHDSDARMKSRCENCGLIFYKTSLNRHKFIHHQKMKLNREDFVVVKNNSPYNSSEKNTNVITKKQNVKKVSSESRKHNQAILPSRMHQNHILLKKTQEYFDEAKQSTDNKEIEKKNFKPTTDIKKVMAENKNIIVSDVHASYLKDDAIKLYKCGECDVYFTRRAACMIHVYKHSPFDTEDYIKCNDCGLQFKNTSFRQHREEQHTKDFHLEEIVVEEYQPNIRAEKAPTCVIYYGADRVQSSQVSTTSETSVLTELLIDTVPENMVSICDNDIPSSITKQSHEIVTKVQYIENVEDQEYNKQVIVINQEICEENDMSNKNVNMGNASDESNIVANIKHADKYTVEQSMSKEPKKSCDNLEKRNYITETNTPQVEIRKLKVGSSPVSLVIEELNKTQSEGHLYASVNNNDKTTEKSNSNIIHNVFETSVNVVTDINIEDNITLQLSDDEIESDTEKYDETIENIIEFLEKQNPNKTKETNDLSSPKENVEKSHSSKKSRTLEDIVKNIHAMKNINEPISLTSQVCVEKENSFGNTLVPANKPSVEDILNISPGALNVNMQITNSCYNIEPVETSEIQMESYKERNAEITHAEICSSQHLDDKQADTSVMDNNIIVKSIEIRKNQNVNTSLPKSDECRKETTEIYVENANTTEFANVNSDSVKEVETRETDSTRAVSFEECDEPTKTVQTGGILGTEITNTTVNICTSQSKSNNSAKVNILQNIIINRDNIGAYHESIQGPIKAISVDKNFAKTKESVKNIIDKEIFCESTDFAEEIINNNKTVKANVITHGFDVPQNCVKTAYLQNITAIVNNSLQKQQDINLNRTCNTERDEIVVVLNENIANSKCNKRNETSQIHNITDKSEKSNNAAYSKALETDEYNKNAGVLTQFGDSSSDIVADSNGISTVVRELIVTTANKQANLSETSNEINPSTLITSLRVFSDNNHTDSKLADGSMGVLSKDITHDTVIRKNIDKETDDDVEIIDIQTETPITIEDSDGETDHITVHPETIKKEKLWSSGLTETAEPCNTNVIQIDDDTSDISTCITKLINTLNQEPKTSKRRQKRIKSLGNERDIIQIDDDSIQITNSTVKQEKPHAFAKKLSGNRHRASIQERQAYINLDSDDEADSTDLNKAMTIKKEKTFDKGRGKRNAVVLTREIIEISSDDEN